MKQRLRTNQHGIAHLGLILVVVLLLGVGGAGYYVWSQNKDEETGGTSQSSSIEEVEAECKRTIEDKDLCKMASSTDYDKENYVITITGSQEGQQFSWTIQNDGENSQVNMLGFESISYNGDTNTKDTSGTWVKYSKSDREDEDPKDDLTESLDFSDEEASYYTKVGKEPCGNLTCFHYSYKDPSDSSNNAEFWFDDKEYKIRRVTSVTPEGVTVEMVITYGNAKVTPPETYTTSS